MKSLGFNPEERIGTKDAVHVHIVIAEKDSYKEEIKPGDWVKFTDDKYNKIIKCEKVDAHGIVDPFLDEYIYSFDKFAVLLVPGIASAVRHDFEINPNFRVWEKEALEDELKEIRDNDSDCGDCWQIRNNKIIRM